MLGEIRTAADYYKEGLFGYFKEISRSSSVPASFIFAWTSEMDKYLVANVNGPLPMQRISYGLVENEFSNPDLAFYAVQYGIVVSCYKILDLASCSFRKTKKINQSQNHSDENTANYLNYLLEFIEFVNENVEYHSELILNTESRLAATDMQTLARIKRVIQPKKNPSLCTQMGDCRTYMENYFSIPQKVANTDIKAGQNPLVIIARFEQTGD